MSIIILFYESTCSLGVLDENSKHTIFFKFWDLKKKGYKAKDSFKKSLDKKIMFNGFKMFSFKHMSQV